MSLDVHDFVGVTRQAEDARDLHRALEVGKDFSTWIKDRIEEYGFIEGQDFVKFGSPKLGNQSGMKSVRGGDRRSIDYHVSFDMAKELGILRRWAAFNFSAPRISIEIIRFSRKAHS